MPPPEPARRFGTAAARTGGLRDAGFVIVRVPRAEAAETGELVPNQAPAVPTVPRGPGAPPHAARPPEIGIDQHVPGEYREIIGATRP